jgi:hypothetical protein
MNILRKLVMFAGGYCAGEVAETAVKALVPVATKASKATTVKTKVGAYIICGMVFDAAYKYVDKTLDDIADVIIETESFMKELTGGK